MSGGDLRVRSESGAGLGVRARASSGTSSPETAAGCSTRGAPRSRSPRSIPTRMRSRSRSARSRTPARGGSWRSRTSGRFQFARDGGVAAAGRSWSRSSNGRGFDSTASWSIDCDRGRAISETLAPDRPRQRARRSRAIDCWRASSCRRWRTSRAARRLDRGSVAPARPGRAPADDVPRDARDERQFSEAEAVLIGDPANRAF